MIRFVNSVSIFNDEFADRNISIMINNMEKLCKKKICFAASSGGHYEQLMMLRPLIEKYDSFVITEETEYNEKSDNLKTYYMKQVNRKELKLKLLCGMVINTFRSFIICAKEKPDVVICTGVLAMIPICLISKLCGSKLVYIESYAKVTSATMTGRLLYRYADQFYVQWPQMKKIYPDAIYLGSIY